MNKFYHFTGHAFSIAKKRSQASNYTLALSALTIFSAVSMSQKETRSDESLNYRPSKNNFLRIDVQFLKENDQWVARNAIHETLRGPGKIESYEIFKMLDADEIWAVIKFGDSLNGHPNIVHGGITVNKPSHNPIFKYAICMV